MKAVLIDKYGFKKSTDVADDRRVVAVTRFPEISPFSTEQIDPSKDVQKNYAEFYFERTFENEDGVRIAIYREK